MMHILSLDEVGPNADLLEQMFRLRHRIFKQKLGWVVGSDNGREADEFDTATTRYLVSVAAGTRQVTGAWRLIPTTSRTMAYSVFRDLMAGSDFTPSHRYWEVSRFVIDSEVDDVPGLRNDHTMAELICGLHEFCLNYDIRRIVTIQDYTITRLVNRLMKFQPSWSGQPLVLGEKPATACLYDVRSDTLLHLRNKFAIPAPVVEQFRIPEMEMVA